MWKPTAKEDSCGCEDLIKALVSFHQFQSVNRKYTLLIRSLQRYVPPGREMIKQGGVFMYREDFQTGGEVGGGG